MQAIILLSLIIASMLLPMATSATPLSSTMIFVDDLGRRVEIPAKPQRIVSTDDVFVTVPLLELRAPIVGSQGRLGKDGTPWLRSSMIATGTGFAPDGMAFLGADPIDVEAVVAANPDLIITMATRTVSIEQLSQIAPTLVFNPTMHTPRQLYRRFAEAVGRIEELDRLEAQYRTGINLIKAILPHPVTISLFDATENRKIGLYHTYGALGEAARDAGLGFPELVDKLPKMQSVELSPEVLPALDANIIVGTYRDDRNDTPADARTALSRILPEYCIVLNACSKGRMFFFPRDIARSNTYAARMMSISFLLAVLPTYSNMEN